MKSQVNRSPWSACLASSSCALFSPTSSIPAAASAGRSSGSTYFTAARISTSGPIRSRTASRLPRTRSGSIAHNDARLAAGHAVVAAVGEIELWRAAGAAVQVLDVRDASSRELSGDHGAQVEHAPGSRSLDARERLHYLRPDLVAATPDARTDGGRGRRREAGHRLLDDAAGQRPP